MNEMADAFDPDAERPDEHHVWFPVRLSESRAILVPVLHTDVL